MAQQQTETRYTAEELQDITTELDDLAKRAISEHAWVTLLIGAGSLCFMASCTPGIYVDGKGVTISEAYQALRAKLLARLDRQLDQNAYANALGRTLGIEAA